jgi:calcium-dependent protein kinase
MKVLKSTNIVELFDVMESSHNYYIIQELCDTDLERYLKQHPNKTLPEK